MALLAANVIVLGALTVYYVLMSKFLFGFGQSIYDLTHANTSVPIMPYVDDLKCTQAQGYQQKNYRF